MRLGLTLVLERSARFRVCGSVGSPAEAYQCVGQLNPDFIVLDFEIGGQHGVECVRDMVALYPPALILAYTGLPELTYAWRVFQAGGHGYLMKDDDVERVPDALEVLAQGRRYASTTVQAELFQRFASGKQRPLIGDPLHSLTAREIQVLRLLGLGRTLAQMSEELNLSVKTLGTHRERLKNKLGADTANELARLAGSWVGAGRV
jgi:two-component system invasion response regulator UvrY